MKTLLSSLALSLVSATAAHAGDVFHRSQEAGTLVYRGTQTLPATLPYQTYEAERRALDIQAEQARAQIRLQSRELDILEARTQAEARYLRNLERRDTALVRRRDSYFYHPRFNRNINSFGVVVDSRRGRRRARGGH